MEPSSTAFSLWQALDSSHIKRSLRMLFAFCFITFGQPVYSPVCSLFASTVGFALLFYDIAKLDKKARFFWGASFFFLVQCVQLFWCTYHPVVAARGIFLLLPALMGMQFGLLCLLVNKKVIYSRFLFLVIPAAWTVLEWSRIFWCSGFYFNLVGLSMASWPITLQTASVFGVLGMSFWVMLTNVAFLRAFLTYKKSAFVVALILACLPYLYGSLHLWLHTKRQQAYDAIHPHMNALVVHSKKVPEEFSPPPRPRLTPQQRSFNAWKELITAIAPFYQKERLDLILMPEGVVPYGSTTLLFDSLEINSLFLSQFQTPFPHTTQPLLTSEDIAKEIAHLYSCPLIIGLEGIKQSKYGDRPLFYNSAFFFSNNPELPPQRYDKQVLVPMGEYIPFEFAKKWAAKYGVYDSFTPGDGAKPFISQNHRIGASICYEETVGNLMRQNAVQGATLLVNLTDDYWFPYSMLAQQHFEHARPRTVENGVPLIRSCNFGVSGVVDSLGRTVLVKEGSEKSSGFVITFSTYHYPTLYGKYGDWPILILSASILLIGLCFLPRKQ